MSQALMWRLRVWAARTQQALGWAGLVGSGLLLAALVWLGLAWQAHRVPLPQVSVLAPAVTEVQKPVAASVLELPHRSDVPLLLTQIQQTVVNQGLAWAAADYKLLPVTESAPAAMEVRCTLKGAYPKLRAAMAQLLSSVPGLTARDLTMSRANADTPEVEAKLTLVVFLQDRAPAAEPASQSVKP